LAFLPTSVIVIGGPRFETTAAVPGLETKGLLLFFFVAPEVFDVVVLLYFVGTL